MVGLGGHHVPTLAGERIARLSSGPAASITGTLTHPTITNETNPHFAEALRPYQLVQAPAIPPADRFDQAQVDQLVHEPLRR